MTFKKLFSRFSFAEIKPAFKKRWQPNEPKQAEPTDLGKWKRIYQKVQALEAKASAYCILLRWRWISLEDGMKRKLIIIFVSAWIISVLVIFLSVSHCGGMSEERWIRI